MEDFKTTHYVSDEDIEAMKGIEIPQERTVQDKASIIDSFFSFAQKEQKKEQKS